MGEYVVELKNITKRFPGVVALNNMQLAVKPGEIHGLIGENGAGKSTLIKVLTGVHKPDEGEIYVNGEKQVFKNPNESAAAGNPAYENTVFLGFDGIQSACNSILAGELTMSVCQAGYDMGYQSVDAVVRALAGEKLDQFIEAKASIVDPSSAQARLELLQGYLA